MRKCLVFTIVFLMFVLAFSSVSVVAQSEEKEFEAKVITCYYDVIIYPKDDDPKSIKEAILLATVEFKETLKTLCDSRNVEYLILNKSGPDPINTIQKISFTVRLSGDSKDIREVDEELDSKYKDPPTDPWDY